MSNRKEQAAQRAARLAAIRAEQQRRDRRHRNLVYGVGAGVLLGLIGLTVFTMVRETRAQQAAEAAAAAPIDGVEVFDDLTRNHVQVPVDYAVTPPAGGDHNPVWQNCGAYAEPVEDEMAVHSLEHGAVWLAYREDLPADQVDALKDAVADQPYALLAPYPGLESPVVLSAWGAQLRVEDAQDPRIPVFLEKYLQGPQTPEPGAACFGGAGTPTA